VSVYAPSTGRRLRSAAVAADPYGLARTPDGRSLVVTSGATAKLTVLAADTLAVRCAVAVGREPRGLALTPDGRRALVAHVAGEALDGVDLAGCAAVAVPPVPLHAEESWTSGRLGDVAFTTHPRPSQAWALVADGARVWVPFMANRTGREVPPGRREAVYGAGVVRPETPDKTSFALAAFDTAAWRWVDAWLPRPHRREIAGPHLPMAVTLCRSDGSLRVASAGTHAVAVLTHHEGRGPTIDVTVGTVDVPQALACLRDARMLTYSPVTHALEVNDHGVRRELDVSESPLGEDEAEGRRLFYEAIDRRISTGGLACAGCHPEGRDDGLTWFLRQGPRQTPTLAGRLVAPFNWNGTQTTMNGNLEQTVHRLGGRGLAREDLHALATYVQRGLVAPAARTVVSEEVARGRAVFAEAGCEPCHDPERGYADGRTHVLGGLRGDEAVARFDTPSLRGVASTAPYFHDGRYATLDAMLRDPRHRMGDLRGVGERDRAALVAFLETL
jgi:hypothetical protein